MGDDVQIFEHEKFGEIRVVDQDGDPWFVAKDVCFVLGFEKPADAVRGLDRDEKGTFIMRGTNGNPDKTIISESGLYSLILRSRKKEAKAFKRWVTHDVLPSIRKHGAYMTPPTIDAMLADPRKYAELLYNLANERDKLKFLNEKEHIFGNRTPYGTISRHTGEPRTKPVRGYLRTDRNGPALIITEYQLRLFEPYDF